jgi:NhaP-type Na+/H+ or K+/H+ antiporter
LENPETATLLTTLAAAVSLGMLAQLVAERFKVPAILPLLLLGIAAGSSDLGFGWVDPHSLGNVLEVLVHLGVAVILFEGGLSLDLRQLARVSGTVRNLLTLGVAVTGVGAAALARGLTGIPWPTAALFGAIVTVTGPTVVAPLLRHMIAPREVKTVLLSEGLIIDPIGAVLAYLVLQWIERAGVPARALSGEILILVLTGSVVGFFAGSLARWLARSRLTSGELRNLTVLALLVLAYLVSEHQAPQSGIVAAVVMGLTMSASEIPDLVALKAFKGQLTLLFISVLFILLSAHLDVAAMVGLGWRGLAVAAGLVLAVRPAAVFLSVWQGSLGMRERWLLAMTAPRGIVAAAVASLAAGQLDRAGGGGAVLEGLVYLVILVSGVWATLAAVALPRLLGYHRDPSRRLTVLIGATPLSEQLAAILRQRGRTVAVVDSSRAKLDGLRQRQVRTYAGDARNATTYEEVGVEPDTVALALTPNDELNLVIADLLRDEFGVQHPVVVLQQPSEEFGTRRRAWIDLFGGRALSLPGWIRRLEGGRARFLTLELPDEAAREQVRQAARELPEEVLVVCGWKEAEPTFTEVLEGLEQFGGVTVLAQEGEALEALASLAATPAAGEEGEAGTEPPTDDGGKGGDEG